MNLLARLGILFFTQTEKAAKGIADLEERLERLREKSKAARSRAMDRASGSARALAQEFDNLSSSAASGINLSSSLDSTYAQFDKTAQKLAATMGVSAKTIKQQAGFFYDLNLNGDEWLQTSAMMNKYGLDPKKMGVGGLKDYAKALDVIGASGPEMTKVLLGVRQGFNQTDEELGMLLDDVAFIGKQFGSSSEFVSQFGTVTGALNEQLRKIDPTADAKKYRDYAQQIYLVAGALQETVNADPATALSQSVELFGKLADTQADFESLFAGAGNGVPELMNQVAMAMGGFDEIKASPLKFIEAISTAYAQASDEQRFFMRKQLTNTFGADIDKLLQGDFGQVAGKLKTVRKEVDNSTGSFKELAKAFRTGFTQQDLYNRAAEKFEHRLTGMANKMGVQSEVLKNQQKSYKLVGAQLEHFSQLHKDANHEMTVGERAANLATRAFLSYRVAGVQGLSIEMSKAVVESELFAKVTSLVGADTDASKKKIVEYTGAMSAMAPQTLSTMEALNRAGINFQNLGAMTTLAMTPLRMFDKLLFGLPGKLLGVLGPIGLLAGAGFLIYKNWDKGVGKWFNETWGKLEKKVEELAPKVKAGLLAAMNRATEKLNSADAKGAGEKAAVLIGKVFNAAGEFMGDVLGGLYTAIFADEEANKKAANTAGESLGKAFGNMSGAAVSALGRGLAGAIGKGLDYLTSDATIGDKAKTVGTFLAGMIGTGLALRLGGAVTGSAAMSGVGRALMAPATLAAGAAAKPGRLAGAANKLKGGAAKLGGGSAMKGVGALAGAYAFATEGPAAFEAGFDLINSGAEMGYDKLNETGYKSAAGFAKIIDTIFLGIPSTILKYLGIGQKEFKIFYNELVTETSIRINQVITFFNRLGIDAARVFEFAKYQVKDLSLSLKELGAVAAGKVGVSIGGMFGDLEDNLIKGQIKFQTFFESIRTNGELVFAGLKFTLRDFANNVLDEYLSPVLSRIEDVSVNALRLARKLGVPTGGLNEADLRLASRMGLDKAGIELRRREEMAAFAKDFKATQDSSLERLKQIGVQHGMDPESLRRITTVEQMMAALKSFDPGRGNTYRQALTAMSDKVINQYAEERRALEMDQRKTQAILNADERRLMGEQRLFETSERMAADEYARGLYMQDVAAPVPVSAPAQIAAVAPPDTPKVGSTVPAQTASKKKAGAGLAELAAASTTGFRSVVDKLDEVVQAVKTSKKPRSAATGDAEMLF